MPFSMTTVRREGTPSPSKGLVPKPPTMVPSSMTVTPEAAILLAELAGEKRCAAINGVAVHAFENMFEDRSSDHGGRT